MRWSWILLVFCLACESKPLTSSPPPETRLAKVTREAPSAAQAEYGVRIFTSPRRHQELEAGILGHPEVRRCVDQGAAATHESFDVILSGRLIKEGGVAEARIEKASKAFELCLTPALAAVNLGKGRSGPFKMRIYRKVSQNQIKKFE